jgi:pteridine reductase
VKLALVTGSYHRLGAAIARRLADEGFEVALHGSGASSLESGLAEALDSSGVRWASFTADLTDDAQLDGLLPAVRGHFGALPGLLVNSASAFQWDDWQTLSTSCMMHHYQVNVAAGVRLACELARHLPDAECATVVTILDQRVANPHGDQLSYTISKQAAAEAVRTLARTLAPRVRVCGVAPGLTLPTDDFDEGQLSRLAKMMPLGRLPDPGEIAAAVAFLAGAQSITGQTIFVDGGAHLESYDRDFVRLGKDV